jgi:hypothetical protein
MTTMNRSQIAGTLHGAEMLADQIAGSRVTPATFQDSPLMQQLVARINEIRLVPHMTEPAFIELMTRKKTISNRLNALMVFYGNSKAAEPLVAADVPETDGSEYLGKSCRYCGAKSPDKRADNMRGLFSRRIIDPADTEVHYCCATCDSARGLQTLVKFENWIQRLVEHSHS